MERTDKATFTVICATYSAELSIFKRPHNFHYTTISMHSLSFPLFRFSRYLLQFKIKLNATRIVRNSYATTLSTAISYQSTDSLFFAICVFGVHWIWTARSPWPQCRRTWSCVWLAQKSFNYIPIKYKQTPLHWVPEHFTCSILLCVRSHLRLAGSRERINSVTSEIQHTTVRKAGWMVIATCRHRKSYCKRGNWKMLNENDLRTMYFRSKGILSRAL